MTISNTTEQDMLIEQSRRPHSAALPDHIPEPVSQGKPKSSWLPEWVRQLPLRNVSRLTKSNFQLIEPDKLAKLIAEKDLDADAVARIRADIEFLESELLRLFRVRDGNASQYQYRYRRYQVFFIILATVATILGTAQALLLTENANLVPYVAFGETVVALFATYLARLSNTEPPLPRWLLNRRRAEYLRREYFRFLVNAEPYRMIEADTENEWQVKRKLLLSTRAAEINRGISPDKLIATLG